MRNVETRGGTATMNRSMAINRGPAVSMINAPSFRRAPEARFTIGGSHFGAAERAARPSGVSSRGLKITALRQREGLPELRKAAGTKQRVTNAEFKAFGSNRPEKTANTPVSLVKAPRVRAELPVFARRSVDVQPTQSAPVTEKVSLRKQPKTAEKAVEKRTVNRSVNAPRSAHLWAERGMHRTSAAPRTRSIDSAPVRPAALPQIGVVEQPRVASVPRTEKSTRVPEHTPEKVNLIKSRSRIVDRPAPMQTREVVSLVKPELVVYQRRAATIAPAPIGVIDQEEVARRLGIVSERDQTARTAPEQRAQVATVVQTERVTPTVRPETQTQVVSERVEAVRAKIAALPVNAREAKPAEVAQLQEQVQALTQPAIKSQANEKVLAASAAKLATTEATRWQVLLKRKIALQTAKKEKPEYAVDDHAQERRSKNGEIGAQLLKAAGAPDEVSGESLVAAIPEDSSLISQILNPGEGSSKIQDGSWEAVKAELRGVHKLPLYKVSRLIQNAIDLFPAVRRGKGKGVSDKDIELVLGKVQPKAESIAA